jgi:hypothetical protein
LALELLGGCGMIRRSEKRSLIGPEALGSWISVLKPSSQAAAESAASTNRFFVLVPGTHNLFREQKNYATVGEPFLNMLASKRKTWQLRITF